MHTIFLLIKNGYLLWVPPNLCAPLKDHRHLPPTSHCMFHEWCPVLRGYTPVISVSIPVSCPVSPEDYFTIPIVCIPLVTLLGFKYTYINIY